MLLFDDPSVTELRSAAWRRLRLLLSRRAVAGLRLGAPLHDEAVHQTADQSAGKREHDEHPELLERPAADEHGRGQTARRVHGSVGELVTGMLMRWISVSVRPMARGAKPAGARRSVTPAITSRKTAVSTSSTTMAAASE